MSGGPVPLVKCVAWDIDHTLLAGVYLEAAGALPPADPVMSRVLARLAGRGVLHAIASKNPPEAAAYAARVTGAQFAAAECGWDAKPAALKRIAAALGIGTDALAFVDDDPYERAEVAAALPEVFVLSPEEMAEAADGPEFTPPAVTDEGRRRGELYAARQRRLAAARAFTGSTGDFLRAAGTRVAIAPAVPGDAPRLHELSLRTRQFNSAAQVATAEEFTALITGGACEVFTVSLRDAFSDDGMVGGCVVAHDGDGTWTVRLLMMSCRAMGRGVIGALLAWLTRAAARAGARAVEVPCVLNDRNLPLRLALAGAGFRAASGGPGTVPVVFRRRLRGALPGLADWVSAPGEPGPGAVAAEIRGILAAVTGREEMLGLPEGTALFGAGVGLDSLTGTLLLREVHRRFGVDVAAEDLNLDALATLGTLTAFVAGRLTPAARPPGN